MNRWYWRARYYILGLSSGGLFLVSSCGLSDQEWATVWESVVSSALSTIVDNVLLATTGTVA